MATNLPEKNYYTISEISKDLGIEKYILRFWETKFPQIKPLKLAGSRRYFRPEDIEIIKLIKFLLHEKGIKIKGVQKFLASKEAKNICKYDVKNVIPTFIREEFHGTSNSQFVDDLINELKQVKAILLKD